MIKLNQVSFSYESREGRQLDQVTFSIPKGSFVLLCGKSACGKTTVTKCLNGLIPHFMEGTYEGSVTIGDRAVKSMEMYEISEKVGSVFQNPKTQFFNLDSDSELVFGLENLGVEPKLAKSRLKEVTEDLEIENLLDQSVFDLSSGEKQILALASVYAVNPDVYVLDEPTANIDRWGIERLHGILKKLKAMGKTVIISEHRFYFLMDLIDLAVYIDHGKVEHIYSGEEFRAMEEEERIRLGLRCFQIKEKESLAADEKTEGLLTVRDAGVGYKKKTILEGISFGADRGDIIAVTGDNGSGKTAFLRMLCGLMKEKGGSVSFEGKKYPYKKRREICYMTMQDVVHQLFSDSVREEFSMLNQDVDQKAVMKILERLDLIDYADKHPMTLSGGQKQRLAIAVATISGKEILIFDEPTSGLDYGNMHSVASLIRGFSKDHIIFVATHDREFLKETCTREFVLKNGTLQAFRLED